MQHTLFYTLLVLICFSPKIANTQNFDINWTEKQKGLPSSLTFDVMGLSENAYYTLIYGQKNIRLQANSYKHDFMWRQDFPRKKNGIKLLGIKHLALSSGDYFVFREYNSKTEQWQYHFTNTDKAENQERQLLANIDIGQNPDPSVKLLKDIRYYKDKDIYATSKDQNTFALMNHIPYTKKQNDDQLNIHVFDHQMQLLWKQEKTFSFPDQKLFVANTLINQQGEVFVLAKLIDKADLLIHQEIKLNRKTKTVIRKKQPNNYAYVLYKFTKSGVEEYDISVRSNLKIVEAKLLEQSTKANSIIVTGFYVDSENDYCSDGTFFNTINTETGKQRSTVHPIEPTTIAELTDDKQQTNCLNQNFRVQQTFEFNDGNFGFIAEEYYYNIIRTPDGINDPLYHSDNFFINIFTTEGDTKIIPIQKHFVSSYYNSLSFALSQQEDLIFLFYNTFLKDFQQKERKPANLTTFTDLVIVDSKGKEIKHERLSSRTGISRFAFLPTSVKQKGFKTSLLKTGGYRYQVGIMDLRY